MPTMKTACKEAAWIFALSRPRYCYSDVLRSFITSKQQNVEPDQLLHEYEGVF